MSKKWYPVIDEEKCVECGICVANCKHGVYKQDSMRPIVLYPENCMDGCEFCMKLCPQAAINYVGRGTVQGNCGCGCGCGCK